MAGDGVEDADGPGGAVEADPVAHCALVPGGHGVDACVPGGERTKISGERFLDSDLEAYQYVQMFFSDVMGAWSFSVAMISASVRVSLLGT